MAAPNLTKQPQKSFWDSRMNKSNFWNLMFGIGMVLGGFITLKFGKAYPTPAFICAWTTLIGVPLTVRYFSKITFTDGKFLTIEGRELDIPKQLPNGFLLIATTIGTVILVGAIADKLAKTYPDVLINSVFVPILLISLFFIPVLFFILKNCPIPYCLTISSLNNKMHEVDLPIIQARSIRALLPIAIVDLLVVLIPTVPLG